jgi:hypothetical protein
MYAVANIAKAQQAHSDTAVGILEFMHRYDGKFTNGCFMFEGIVREQPRGATLSKITAGKLSNITYPYEHTYEHVDIQFTDTCVVIPFGVPETDEQWYCVRVFLTGCYLGKFNGKHPNDELNCTVLFALMQNTIYELARLDRTLNDDDKRHFTKVLLTLYYITKALMANSQDVRDMIHTLAQCSEAKDVLQCELATLLDGQQMSPAFFQRILSLAFARQMHRYGKEEWSRVTLDRYSGMNALFTIVPLLTHTTSYSNKNIKKFMQLLKACADAFKEHCPDLTHDNSTFQVSAEICHLMVGNMINIIGIKVNHPGPTFFKELFTEIASKNFNFTRVSEKSTISHNPVEIPVDKEGHLSKPIVVVNGKFVSPTVTEWGSTCFIMGINTTYNISANTLTTANVVNGDTRRVYGAVANAVFIGHGGRAVQLCYNPNGSYSPMTNQRYDPHLRTYVPTAPTQFPIKMSCTTDGITIFGSDGHVRYHVHGQRIVLAVKNAEVTITY